MTKPLLTALCAALVFFGVTVASGQRPPAIEHTHTYTWTSNAIVGLSALEVRDGGRTFHALGDRGWYLSGTFERTGGGISGVELEMILPILGIDGWPVAARRVGDLSDAEGLAIAPDDTMWISFERWTRVVRYSGPEDGGRLIRPHPTFADYPDNRQLEALALHPDGTLYAFAEAARAEGFAIYRLREGGAWDIAGHIPRRNRYAIVGADFDAEGHLFLLERRHFLGWWWQSRISRLDITAPETMTTLWTSRMGDYDNLEGIAAWQDGAVTYLTVVSDNNGVKPGRTQFLEFRVTAP